MLPRKPKLPFRFLISSIKEFENRLGRKLKDNFTKVLSKKKKKKNNRPGKLETLQLPGEGKTEKKSDLLS